MDWLWGELGGLAHHELRGWQNRACRETGVKKGMKKVHEPGIAGKNSAWAIWIRPLLGRLGNKKHREKERSFAKQCVLRTCLWEFPVFYFTVFRRRDRGGQTVKTYRTLEEGGELARGKLSLESLDFWPQIGSFLWNLCRKGSNSGTSESSKFSPPSNFQRFDPPIPVSKCLEDYVAKRFGTISFFTFSLSAFWAPKRGQTVKTGPQIRHLQPRKIKCFKVHNAKFTVSFKNCDPRVPLQRSKLENRENDIFGGKKWLEPFKWAFGGKIYFAPVTRIWHWGGNDMPQKAHLNGSKRDPQKGIFDPKNVTFPIFPFWPLWGDPGITIRERKGENYPTFGHPSKFLSSL